MRRCAACVVAMVCVAGVAEACTCGPRTLRSCFDGADAVFAGRVVAIRDSTREPIEWRGLTLPRKRALIATIKVSEAWKGVPADTTVSVVGGRGFAGCGFPFRMNTRVIVFGGRSSWATFGANVCDGTGEDRGAARDSLRLYTGRTSR